MSRHNIKIAVIGIETGEVQQVLEGVEKLLVIGAARIAVVQKGVERAYTPGRDQALAVSVGEPVVEQPKPIVVGGEQRTCTFLVTIEGANFAKQCGDPAPSGDRCQEHQGR